MFFLMTVFTGIVLAGTPKLSTQDGSIVALDLTDSKWHCEVRSATAKNAKPVDGKYSGGSIRCRLKEKDTFLFMNIMSYRVPKNQIISVERLISDFYPNRYRRQFQKSMVKPGDKVAHYGMHGQKYTLFATHKRQGPINKIAEIYVDGQWFFSISLEGNDSVFKSHGKEVGSRYGKWLKSLKLNGAGMNQKP